MKRRNDLPDFGRPPLNEVLMGIQFVTPPTYQQIRAGEVWALFKNNYPNVQELPPLPPQFETFGQPIGAQFHFGVVAGAQHDRFWFVSNDGKNLIQFQNDRLILNWRKLQTLDNDYPRYEKLADDFERQAKILSKYFESIGGAALIVNQCEISYVNHITTSRPGRIRPSEWLSFIRFGDLEPDDFSLSFRRRILSATGDPIGRLSFEAATSVKPDGQEFIILTITARAMPKQPSLPSSLEFFAMAREMIVKSFAEVTTDSAHQTWERVN